MELQKLKTQKGEMLGSEGFQNYIKKYKDEVNSKRLNSIIDQLLKTGHVQRDDLTVVVIDAK